MNNETTTTPGKQTGSVKHDLPEWFTEIGPEQRRQHERLVKQVELLNKLVSTISFDKSEQKKSTVQALNHAKHLLDYARPYNISLIGMSGAGKSTLINALIGRDLLPSRRGRATTGTIVTVIQKMAQDGSAPGQQAKIHYHTPESLTKEAKRLSDKLKVKMAKSTRNPSLIDIENTLNILSSICQVCAKPKLAGTKFCRHCNAPHDLSRGGQVNPLPEFTMLQDLLQSAKRQSKRLLEGPNPEIMTLETIEDIRHVQALMDEESEINKQGSSSRVIRLIQRIDYEITILPEQLHENLAYIKLTDTPGLAALTLAHDEHLRKQLNPFETDAIILVMKPDRPEAMIKAMVPLIENLLMQGLKPHERDLVAGRIFLVVNKTDEIAPERSEDAEKDLRQGVEKVGDKILMGFCDDHPDHVFYKVKAQPALIAQLIRRHEEAARIWLAGQSDPHFRFNRSYYHPSVTQRALHEYSALEQEEAVLQWSQIPELRQRLKEFLMNRRWQQDLKQAQALYSNAYGIVSQQINEEWKKVTGKYFSQDAQNDLERLSAQEELRYSQELQAQAEKVHEAFSHAHNNLQEQQQGGEALAGYLQDVLRKIEQDIVTYTDTLDFKKKLMSTARHRIFGTSYNNPGTPDALVELDTQIYKWFDKHIENVAETMMSKLRTELDQAKVETALSQVYFQLPRYETYLDRYHKEIIESIHTQYQYACRGAILYQKVTRQVVDEIFTDADFQTVANQQRGIAEKIGNNKQQTASKKGRIGSAAWMKTANTLVAKIREKYTAAHKELINTMPHHLAALFFYHLTNADKDFETLIGELGFRLALDVRDKQSDLYKQKFKSESDKSARRAKLYKYWQELQTMK